MSDGETILDEIIPARSGWSGKVMPGEILTLIDLEGQQAVDALFYNLDNTQERYHAPNTLKAAGTTLLSAGHTLYSDVANPMMTIIEDTFGGHDTIGGCCSRPSNEMLYGVANDGCRETFLSELSKHGLSRRDIVPNVNFFMRVPVATNGNLEVALGVSAPDAHVSLEAKMPVLVVLSNCPQVLNPCNNYNPTAIRITVKKP